LTQPTSPRGRTVCRGCGHEGLASVLDLGSQPLANELLRSPDSEDPAFPLHLRICPNCGLGQVGEYVLPETIFGDYPYLSSMSSTWLAHARSYARAMHFELALQPTDLVMEVASNDGYLLKPFQALGQPVLGIEPAANVAAIATEAGVPTLCAFFGRATAEKVVADRGQPRLVAANNVMAHVPDLDDFVSGLGVLCADDTVVTVENPTMLTMLRKTQFDTIYHEHFSYLTANSVSKIAARHGLELVRVEPLSTHGGSNRYWMARAGTEPADDSVAAVIEHELDQGLLDPLVWQDFARRSRAAISGLSRWLEERVESGRVVAGYGAAAKGNTLMNAAGVTTADLALVTDASPEKQGKFLPGTHIPVAAHSELTSVCPDDVLILPWNLADELLPDIRRQSPGAEVWIAIPEMRRIA